MVKDLTGLMNLTGVITKGNFGLDKETLDRTTQEFYDFCEQAGIIGYPKGWVAKGTQFIDVERYSSGISLAMAMADGNDYRIVEVGVGIIGIAGLAYLASKGISVLGIDSDNYAQTMANRLRVPFVLGRWEQLDIILREHGIDKLNAVYTANMDPKPWKPSQLNSNVFEKQTAIAMKNSLQPGGIYIGSVWGTGDYLYPVQPLVAQGFITIDVILDKHRIIRIAQKTH